MLAGIVAVRPTLGLSNRLRTISSFNVLARTTGREFRLCWAPSSGFSTEDLNDLFVNEFTRIDETEFAALCARGLHIGQDASPSADELLGPAQPVLAYQGYLTVDRAVGQHAASALPSGFVEDYQAELTTWRPVASIERAVAQIAEEFDSNTVGVHVRRGDATADVRRGWKYQISSDRAFLARMDELLRADRRTTFFLATDDAATEQRLRSRYGDALCTNPEKRFVPSIVGQPKENQHDAVIDLLALSRTARIVGNYGSTFSSLAASIGGIPLHRVADKSLPARVRRRITRLRQR